MTSVPMGTMTSVPRHANRGRPVAVLAVAVVIALGSLGGCGGSERDRFVAKANHFCAQARTSFAAMQAPPASSGISYGITYYSEFDRLITVLDTLSPPANDAADIRSRWLRPARAALTDFRPQLDVLRAASDRGDQRSVDVRLARLRSLGTVGVDGDYVASLGATACTPIFGRN